MNPRPPAAVVAALFLLSACASSDSAGSATAEVTSGAPTGIEALPRIEKETGPHVDWSRVGPVAFLDALVTEGRHFEALPEDARERFVPAYTIWESPPADWFTSEEVTELERRVDSTRPAWHVVASKSSILPFGELSTEGEQARYLLQAARVGRYPPGLGSHIDPR